MAQRQLHFHSGYMSEAWNPDSIAETARAALFGVDYDTLVGTGLSGALVVPQLAHTLGVHALIVRKPNDGSHSWLPVEGTLGERWVFVDDFVDSGATRQRVRDTITNEVKRRNDTYAAAFNTEYVGDFLYNSGNFEPSEEPDDDF